jgi:hypothetical protein
VELKERLRRALASTDELAADDERVEAVLHGTDLVAQVRPRERHTVSGVLRSVTYTPSGVRPELAAELYDGSGGLELRWTGRRAVPGIEPGRRLVATGRVTEDDDRRYVIYNPAYTLLAAPAAS